MSTHWPNEKIIELVKVYEEKECLWNPRHARHKCRMASNNAWTDISEALGSDITEVKRKVKNLTGQFYREWKRCDNLKKSGVTADRVTKWFAYEPLLFLKNRNKGRPHLLLAGRQRGEGSTESSRSEIENGSVEEDSESQSIPVRDNMKIEIYRRESGEQPVEAKVSSSPALRPPGSSILIKRRPPSTVRPSSTLLAKRLKTIAVHSPQLTRINPAVRQRVVQNHHQMQVKPVNVKATPANNSTGCKDVNDIFGELVACKMKNLRTDYARTTVEHIISNVLWEASLGKYDYPRPAAPRGASTSPAPSETPGGSPAESVHLEISAVHSQGNCLKDEAVEVLEIDCDAPENFH